MLPERCFPHKCRITELSGYVALPHPYPHPHRSWEFSNTFTLVKAQGGWKRASPQCGFRDSRYGPSHRRPAWLRFSDAPHLVIPAWCPLKRGFRQVQFDKGYGATGTGPASFVQHVRLAQTACWLNDGLPAVWHHRMESMALSV